MNKFEPLHYDQIALINVDVQNDFCPGGNLGVDEGDMVVSALNKVMTAMASRRLAQHDSHGYFDDYIEQRIIATRDWHPAVTGHFSETPNFQTTWPSHCVAGTEGAAFHPDLELKKYHKSVEIISKGTEVDEDAYSGFDGRNELGLSLDEILEIVNKRRTAIFVGGLATDYCVKATVLDARARDYNTFVIEDGIRGVAPESTEAAIEEMKAAGAVFITSDEIVTAYERSR